MSHAYGEVGGSVSRPAFLGIFEGVEHITRSRVIMVLLVLSTATGFFETQLLAIYILAAVKDLLHGGAEIFGLLATIVNIGGILGSLAVNIYKWDEAVPAAVLSASSGASIIPMALAQDFILYAASLFLLGFFMVQASILITTVYQITIDEEKPPHSLASHHF